MYLRRRFLITGVPREIEARRLLPDRAQTGILVGTMGLSMMGPTASESDRRAAKRLLIERDLHFRVLSRRDGEGEGSGKTVNISSSGVLFTTDQPLLPGRRVELAISWPAHLDNRCALKLVARGRVVRFEGNAAALEIIQHEFRTDPGAALRTRKV